jgi:hypothetical protein
MTYQANIPNATQSPGLFPPQCSENFTRLQTIVGANHKFNVSTDPSTDGFHQNVQMIPVSTPSSNNTVGQLYANSADAKFNLNYVDAANNNYQITPTIPIRAAISFDAPGGVIAIGYSFNCTVTNGTGGEAGAYVVTFTSPLPSANYTVSAIAKGTNAAGRTLIVPVILALTNTVQTGRVVIAFINGLGSNDNPTHATITVMGG